MNLEEILNNDKDFTDDIEFELKGQKVTLGGLRELSKAQQKKLSAQLEAASGQQASALQREEKARELAEKAAQLITKLESAGPAPTDDFENDAFWAPVKKRTSTLEQKLAAAEAKVAAQEGQLANAARIWADERWNA